MTKLTQAHIYQTIYIVIKYEYIHLGEDKASRLANKLAVRETWKVYNSPATYREYVNRLIILCGSSPIKDLT